MATEASRPDNRPVEHPNVDRMASAIVVGVPPALLVVAVMLGWGDPLSWQNALIFSLALFVSGIGVTVGFHRLLTHRSFHTPRWLWLTFAAFGSTAAEGPVIEWVATHRRHHRFSDREGDPHSPHEVEYSGMLGALKGLFHAHIGWVFSEMEVASEERYAPDLMADPAMRRIDNSFVVWVLAMLAVTFVLGFLLTGSVSGGLSALLWAGAVRIFVVHHITFSVNSLCHFFGRQPFDTRDQSRDLAWLAPLTFGEAWHNAHHAFPTSARHGLGRRQLDISAAVISLLERVGLAREVVRIDPERIKNSRR